MATAAAVKILPEQAPELGEHSATAGGERNGRACKARVGRIGEHMTATAATTAEQLSDQELGAWRGLLRAHAALAKVVDAELERRHGLPMTSYEVLHHLEGAELGRMRMCDLAEQAQMSRSGLTRLVDRLERDGLLERCSCAHDARGAYACLTEEGRERLWAARSTHLLVVREHFLSRFSSAELSTLSQLWERIAPCCGGC